ncbi:type VI secretion system tip protein TssI/VgrG [Xenorhabdus bovienii]|uniref:Putative Vrg family protein n=1 Tax=Xenorhabdus bovienii str. kraussei Becker Underwood TaxID=1398204 RepID=A0A077PR61_XENBV|nr:type VI secretion system tip protein TssI/VgrG [Xenorhabdus bovienii]CDH26790.1 putative Vrg family protein [Xenorhabdus bovienii str. kraussei Becker Underwood]
MLKSGLRFVCRIGRLPEGTFAVADFTLQERLSELFTLTLTLVQSLPANPFRPKPEIDLTALLMQDAVLQVFHGMKEQRKITGIISQADWCGTDGNKTLYTFTVRPYLWRLTLNQDSHIYHRQSVPDILKLLLKKHQVRADSKLEDAHQSREYLTQKRESDYAFFSRLAAEEGISFWFEDETLFFSDSHLPMAADLTLSYNAQPETAHGIETIYQVRLGVEMTPQRTINKDFNPERPFYALAHLESHPDYQAVGTLTPYTVYESYGRFQKDAEAKPFVKYRHEALKNRMQSGHGQSNCIKLMPGQIFNIAAHPHAPLNTCWQIVGISHQGRCPQALGDTGGEGTTLSNSFSFIDGYADYRPPFHYKPLADGDESATVVGPEGEEIFVNKDGAIKVHFHWNRYDQADDSASCWVRVAQGWNGNGFGFMAIPRIGQEVIVSYLNGDIDRPIVTGCVYNAVNRPPLDLPAAKTRTTFKTKTHKGEGFNELRFDDAKGSEEVFIHAQKDMNTKVLNNRDTHVLASHSETVEKNQTINVYEHKEEDIGITHTHTVGESLAITVGDVIELRCGSSCLRMDKFGNVTLQGTKFLFDAADAIQISAQDIDLN